MAKYHCEIYDTAGFVTFVSNPVILISQPSLERPVLRQKVIVGRKHVEKHGQPGKFCHWSKHKVFVKEVPRLVSDCMWI